MKKTATKIALTDRYLRALKPAPAGTRPEIPDAVQPHLYVRVTERGVVSFMVRKRPEGDGKPVGVTLGNYPAMTLAEARRRAQQVLGVLALGETPRQVEARRRAQEDAQQPRLFAAVAEDYCASEHVARLRSGAQVVVRVKKKLVVRWARLVVTEIRRRDVVTMVQEVAREDGPAAARLALSAASTLFGWAIDMDCYGVQVNPCSGRWDRVLEGVEPRNRALSDGELAAVWRAAEAAGYPFGPVFKMLILSGQRRSEIAKMTWSEVDLAGALLTIPPARMKAKRQHVLPLAPMALALLRSLPRWEDGDHAFSADGGRHPVSGFGNVKKRLDAAAGIAPWRTHDVRHTVRTGLSRLGVRTVVAEMCLAHLQPGIAGLYDHSDFTGEMRDALGRWERHLATIVGDCTN